MLNLGQGKRMETKGLPESGELFFATNVVLLRFMSLISWILSYRVLLELVKFPAEKNMP